VQSNDAAQSIDAHIRQLVTTVQARSGGEAADRLRSNEAEAARLLALTGKLDEGYLDMRQFYAMLLTAITEHNGALDRDITGLLDSAQYQDVFKQIVDRLAPAFSARHALLHTLLAEQEAPQGISDQTHAQAQALVDTYQRAEVAHSDPADTNHAPPTRGAAPLARVELF
jgi:methyl-accepting chemotaxis protein